LYDFGLLAGKKTQSIPDGHTYTREQTISSITTPLYGILLNWFWVSQGKFKEIAKYELK
jgi:hypothetical protein